jgi:pilus assembly protein CpaF
VEDAAELAPPHPHLVKLVARGANVEGIGEITVRDLVRQALRMRPDRIVVGEVRGAEVVDLLGALNTGHDGGAGTVHANNPAEVPARLEALGALGGLGPAALRSQVAAAVLSGVGYACALLFPLRCFGAAPPNQEHSITRVFPVRG